MTPNYTAYLESPEWKHARGQFFKLYRHKCQGCGGSKTIQAHHLFYPKPVEDTRGHHLMPLCKECHEKAHARRERPFVRTEEKIEAMRSRLISFLRPKQTPKKRKKKKLVSAPTPEPLPAPALKMAPTKEEEKMVRHGLIAEMVRLGLESEEMAGRMKNSDMKRSIATGDNSMFWRRIRKREKKYQGRLAAEAAMAQIRANPRQMKYVFEPPLTTDPIPYFLGGS